MEANPKSILKVFSSGGDIRYVLPPFQREYSWEKKQWETLLNDAFAIYEEYDGDENNPPEHFLGSLVVINEGEHNSDIESFKLVDGQQRLTTISLLCCALRELAEEKHKKLAQKYNKLLVNSNESPDDDSYYKLLPTNKYGDRIAYQSIMKNQPLDHKVESVIPSAYQYIFDEVSQKINSGQIFPDNFYNVIVKCFQVVYINLDSNESPYKIFESLNAKGKDLSQADLVRNYIAMRLPIKKQDQIFNNYWAKIESLLQEKRTVGKSRIGELTAFLRHYLASNSKILCAEEHIYARFRDRCEKHFNEDKKFIDEIIRLSKFAEFYNCFLRPLSEKDKDISESLERLNRLDISTAYPFLLSVYYSYNSQQFSKSQFLDILKTLENYLVRRYLVGESTNYLNKMFPSLWHEIQKDVANDKEANDAIQKVLSTKRYPSNEEILEVLKKAKLYENNPRGREKLCFVFESINRHLSFGSGGYTVLTGKATIEHILPQTPNSDWKESLGNDFERIYQNYLNTIGNLTIVTPEWNSSLSNRSFLEKKKMLAFHGLKINSDYFSKNINKWDESEITKRMKFIINKIFDVWPSFDYLSENKSNNYSKPPVFLNIRSELIEISEPTWRQLKIAVVEWGIKNYPNLFLTAQQELATHFCDDPDKDETTKQWQKLSNNIYLSINYSAKDHVRFCTNFLEIMGVLSSEWSYSNPK
ncbi:MAG: DUF262 domain-containing protein [Snowella sp.]|nr:DUF262 domain-containing protein [Snowella sp.]